MCRLVCTPHLQAALRDPLLYGDYRTALQPDQPRVYEDIQDYEAAKGLFDEVYTCTCSTIIHVLYVHVCNTCVHMLLVGCSTYYGEKDPFILFTHSHMHIHVHVCI